VLELGIAMTILSVVAKEDGLRGVKGEVSPLRIGRDPHVRSALELHGR
jgi:hypothetical protein